MTTPYDGLPVIAGAGLAGLMAALVAAPRPVLVLSPARLGEGAATAWAQGGIAAAVGPDDGPDLHLADTLAAGAGLVDEAVARRIVTAAPNLILELRALGVRFDTAPDGTLARGLEAGHSRHRILHAAGDGSGREILRAIIRAVRRTPSITVLEGAEALRIGLRDGEVAALLIRQDASHAVIRTRQVVLATGGIGALFRDTTNPAQACGIGLAIAARAGARLADLEFVQYHPTALDAGIDPMPLISEAVRGDGAILIDETGRRFLEGRGRAELEPRDIVSRAVHAERVAGHQVFLDARRALGPRFAARFPGIAAACARAGIDPAHDPIPVRPAVHYAMGGVAVDETGQSSVPGLYACGEAACTGLHGANRLASNSLLEAALTGQWVGQALKHAGEGRAPGFVPIAAPAPADFETTRSVLAGSAGVLREQDALRAGLAALAPRAGEDDAALIGTMMLTAMLSREESRGAHARTDYPRLLPPGQAPRRAVTMGESLAIARREAKDAGHTRPGRAATR